MSFDLTVRTKEDLIRAVQEYGFVPLFGGSVPGFSVEEHAVPEVWYSPGSDDWKVWEWKGPVIRESGCAYGKFFENRAVFVSREWFPDLANYRRDGYDFDARWDDGLASRKDKDLYDLLDAHAPVISKALKNLGDYRKGGRTGFETSVTRLQAQGYVLISDFVYERNRQGETYGWGLAQYSTPERFFGPWFRETVYRRSPAESYERLLEHLQRILPEAGEAALRKILK
nr:hypothetical protein [Lachnospiraceae bacterium]